VSPVKQWMTPWLTPVAGEDLRALLVGVAHVDHQRLAQAPGQRALPGEGARCSGRGERS